MPPSKYAKAYKKNTSIKDNATPHLKSKLILKLDIKDFFDSISFSDVYNKVFKDFEKPVRTLLSYLCTYKERLPQGAPTSAYISNLIMKDFDEKVGDYCTKENINYTRYSDDMTFSGTINPKEIISKVNTELKKMGMQLNYKKIHIIKDSQRQEITGIVVNEKPNISSPKRKKIRQEMYYIKKYGLTSHMKIKDIKDKYKYLYSLYGKINFILTISPTEEFIQYKKNIINLINE